MQMTLIRALSEGTLDYVINESFRMQEYAILTESTPVALKSANSHIIYSECAVKGSNSNLKINYPTFSHTVKAHWITSNSQLLLATPPAYQSYGHTLLQDCVTIRHLQMSIIVAANDTKIGKWQHSSFHCAQF